MVRFRLYYDKEMETEYLNEMSRQGYAMTGFFAGFYHFDRCAPGEYIYQVDLTEGLFRVSEDYREFMRELGRVNRILAELKGRIGEKVEGRGGLGGSRRLSGVLALGFVLNGIVYLLPESGGDGQMEFLRGCLQGLALAFMLTGLVLTLWKRGE